MNGYLLRFCGASLLCGAAGCFFKNGLPKRALQTVCAFVLLSAALAFPKEEEDWFSYAQEMARLRQEGEMLAERGKAEAEVQTRAGIEDRLDEYIWDKALSLGLRVEAVNVTVAWDREGTWVPVALEAEVSGGKEAEAALSRWIQSELGIPPEKQTWLTEEGGAFR